MQEFDNKSLEELFRLAMDSGASDIHLSSENYPALRVHGDLNYITESKIFPKEELEKFVSEILTPSQLDRFTRTGDLDFAFT